MRKRLREPFKHPVSDDDIIKEALKCLKKRFRKGKLITTPAETIDYLQLKLAEREYEVFCVMYLDNRHRLLCFEELFRGTVDSSHVYPREIVKLALQHNAAAVILAHNHPSGSAEPSVADQQITQRVKAALELVDIRVLDHIVIGAMETVSLAERGLLDTGKVKVP